eukprot:4794557-Amphidinium_carterae.1
MQDAAERLWNMWKMNRERTTRDPRQSQTEKMRRSVSCKTAWEKGAWENGAQRNMKHDVVCIVACIAFQTLRERVLHGVQLQHRPARRGLSYPE